MPLPRPGESKEAFISRFMDSSQARADFPNEKQRAEAAYSMFGEKKDEADNTETDTEGCVSCGQQKSGRTISIHLNGSKGERKNNMEICPGCGAEMTMNPDAILQYCGACGHRLLGKQTPAIEDLPNRCTSCGHPLDPEHDQFGCHWPDCACTVTRAAIDRPEDALPNAAPKRKFYKFDSQDPDDDGGMRKSRVGDDIADGEGVWIVKAVKQDGLDLEYAPDDMQNSDKPAKGGDEAGKPGGTVTVENGADLHCKECGENLGKAVELSKNAYCSTCGASTKNPAGSNENADDTGLCHSCSHPGTLHTPKCQGEGGKTCVCEHFVKRDSDGGPNKPRENATGDNCPICDRNHVAAPHAVIDGKCQACGHSYPEAGTAPGAGGMSTKDSPVGQRVNGAAAWDIRDEAGKEEIIHIHADNKWHPISNGKCQDCGESAPADVVARFKKGMERRNSSDCEKCKSLFGPGNFSSIPNSEIFTLDHRFHVIQTRGNDGILTALCGAKLYAAENKNGPARFERPCPDCGGGGIIESAAGDSKCSRCKGTGTESASTMKNDLVPDGKPQQAAFEQHVENCASCGAEYANAQPDPAKLCETGRELLMAKPEATPDPKEAALANSLKRQVAGLEHDRDNAIVFPSERAAAGASRYGSRE